MTQQLNILQSICCMYGYWLLLKISVSDLLFERTKTLTNQLQFDNCHCYYYFEASYFLVWQKTRLCLTLLFYLHMHLQGVIWSSKFLIWINGRFATWWLFGTFQFVLMSGFYVQEGGSSVKRFSSNFPAPLTAWQSLLLVFCIAFSQVYSCVFV